MSSETDKPELPSERRDRIVQHFIEQREKLDHRIETKSEIGATVAAELDRTIVSLSGGALVFSMTLIDKIAPAKLAVWLLFASWTAFVISLIAVVFAMRAAQQGIAKSLDATSDLFRQLREKEEEALQTGRLSYVVPGPVENLKHVWFHNAVSIVSFGLGIVLLGTFVGYNVAKSKDAQPQTSLNAPAHSNSPSTISEEEDAASAPTGEGEHAASAPSSAAPKAKQFERFDGCRVEPDEWTDGDSFRTRLSDGRLETFRLYFADTTESRSRGKRSDEQAAYFGITHQQAVELGQQAKAFTANALTQPFTIYTRWRGVFGDSRFYAVVLTSNGEDLAELLVRNGLARIHGTRTPLPDGRDSRTYLARLDELENEAKAAKRGGWGIVRSP